jgi:hypothetical protein
MKYLKYLGMAIVIFYAGITVGEQVANPLNVSSTASSPWLKSGTNTTYKMTRVDDPDKQVSCYVLDASSNPILSCVKN